MTTYHDINDLKVFKHRISIIIKTLPYCDNFKTEMLSEIEKIAMPLYRYKAYTRDTNYHTFIGMACSRIDKVLTANKVNPLIIDKVKDLIIKAKL